MIKKRAVFANTRSLTLAAMLTAMSIVIGIFCKNFMNFGEGLFRVSFENFPIILSGIIFGPVIGGLVGAVADMLSYMLSTQSFVISPIVTLGAALVGVVSGWVSHYALKRKGTARIVVSAALAHIVGSLLVKSAGLFAYYGWAVLYRIPTYIIIATIEIVLICLMYKNKNFRRLFEEAGDKNDL